MSMAASGLAVAPWDVAAVLAVGPIWWLAGKAAQRARLPLITGYLLVRTGCQPPCIVLSDLCTPSLRCTSSQACC